MEIRDVVKVILDMAQSIKHRGLMLNERYLHHFFSHLIQERYGSINLTGGEAVISFHPEWPTYKKQTGLTYGRYKSEGNHFRPNSSGKAGFIDFAIGAYKEPNIGIEFSLKYGWSHEEIVYDFLKLLDKKNPFEAVISLAIIFRRESLVRGWYLQDLESHMNEAYQEAVRRLGADVCNNSRGLYFIVTEIDKHNNRRHWHFDRASNRFKDGLPVVA